MASDWSRRIEVDRLADAGERIDFDARLADFPRLAPQLASGAGRATGRIEMSRERGVPVARVKVDAVLPLVCQRCLGPVSVTVQSESRVALVADLDAADRVDPGVEPVVVEGGKIAPRDLVEEELLLAVPLVPRHEDDAQCGLEPAVEAGPGAAAAEEPPAGPEPSVTQKPFAGLGELLKRGP